MDALTYQQAAQRLGMRIGTLYALVSQGRIPHVRVGPRLVRFLVVDLDDWLRAHRVAVAQIAVAPPRRKRRPLPAHE